MNRKPLHTDDSWENDAVWKLLDQAPPASAGPRFADDTVRAARLLEQGEPWWKRLFAPLPLAGLAGAAAALVFSFAQVPGPTSGGLPQVADTNVNVQRAAEIQDIAETETLMTAVDHLDDYSDNELVTLIGF